MSDPITFYWLPQCSTCQKALSDLAERGMTPAERRDLKAAPLGREEVERLAEMAGGADRLFSRRAIKYRVMNLHERELSAEDMIGLMAAEYTFIKRPVVVQGTRAVAGFSGAKAYDRFFEQTP